MVCCRPSGVNRNLTASPPPLRVIALHRRLGSRPDATDAVFGDFHVAVFVFGVLAMQLLRQRQGFGHVLGYRFPVLDRVHTVVASNLPTDARVARPVWSAAGQRLPSLQGRIGIATEPTARSMRPRVGFARALAPLLIADLPLRPLPCRYFAVVAVAFLPILPQRAEAKLRILCRVLLGGSAHK